MTIFKVSSEILQTINSLKGLMAVKLNDLRDKGIIGYVYWPKILFSDISETQHLGLYDRKQNLIVLSTALLGYENSIKNVFLHELAHFLDHSLNATSRHDKTFSDICRLLDVDESYLGANARISIEETEKKKSKIQKLLNLSTSDFEKEAESAILKAQALMEKWDIKIDEKKEELYGVQVLNENKSQRWASHLGYSVCMITGCFSIFQGNGKLFYYGTEDQVEAALYIFDSLVQTIENRCEIIVKALKAVNPNARISRLRIKDGISLGFQEKIKEQNNTQLMIRFNSNCETYKRIYDGKIVYKRQYNFCGNGFQMGKSAGKNIDIPCGNKNSIVKRITD